MSLPNATTRDCRLSGYTRTALAQQIRSTGLTIAVDPFRVNIKTDVARVIEPLAAMYADYRVCDNDYADFHIGIRRPGNLHRWIKPQAVFDFDGRQPFYPLPFAHAYPFFEWGFNWCIGAHAHSYLIFHAGVVERGGAGIIFPGDPGAGKSTLTAALVSEGFRLLSDELTLLATQTGKIIPVPRPVSLKNESIAVIRQRYPQTIFTDPAHDTAKGTVVHMKPPAASIRAAGVTAAPTMIIFPKFRPGAETRLTSIGKAHTAMRLIDLSFNYHILGKLGFELLTALVKASACYEIEYSDLDDALGLFNTMA